MKSEHLSWITLKVQETQFNIKMTNRKVSRSNITQIYFKKKSRINPYRQWKHSGKYVHWTDQNCNPVFPNKLKTLRKVIQHIKEQHTSKLEKLRTEGSILGGKIFFKGKEITSVMKTKLDWKQRNKHNNTLKEIEGEREKHFKSKKRDLKSPLKKDKEPYTNHTSSWRVQILK